MRGRTILVAGITAALLGGSGVAYSDLRDDGSHVHVTNSMDSPVPIRSDNPPPLVTMVDDVYGTPANTLECRKLNTSADGQQSLTSVSMYLKSVTKPAVILEVAYNGPLRYVDAAVVTQATPTSWAAHWTGELPMGQNARSASDEYSDPTSLVGIGSLYLCVKNSLDPITSWSGQAILHPLP